MTRLITFCVGPNRVAQCAVVFAGVADTGVSHGVINNAQGMAALATS